eukprot:SAG11_NODE_114_length_16040_cov_10.050875_19_plen_61_part_00
MGDEGEMPAARFASGSNALPLQIGWDGAAPYLTITTRALFQVLWKPPMKTVAWLHVCSYI